MPDDVLNNVSEFFGSYMAVMTNFSYHLTHSRRTWTARLSEVWSRLACGHICWGTVMLLWRGKPTHCGWHHFLERALLILKERGKRAEYWHVRLSSVLSAFDHGCHVSVCFCFCSVDFPAMLNGNLEF